MELIVEYRYPQANGNEPEGLRLTVGTTNMIEHARFQRLSRECWQWWQDRRKERSLPELPEPDDPDWIVTTAGLRRAYMLAALRKVEVLRAGAEGALAGGQAGGEAQGGESKGGESADVDWVIGELPPAWSDMVEMISTCPADLFEKWAAAVEACNPGQYWQDLSDRGKARAGATVSASPNSSALSTAEQDGTALPAVEPESDEGLIHDASLTVFTLWYCWRNLPGAPSLVELIDLAERPGSPGWIADFNLILRQLGLLGQTSGFFESLPPKG